MTSAVVNARWAATMVDELVRGGLRRVIIAPGSRSTPLTLAFAACSDVHVTSLIDERGAAFFALGAAKASNEAVAVLTTSGTAAANLFPAIIEANLSGVPLIAITADRPPELRGVGANQTIDQIRLYGGHVRAFEDLAPPSGDEDALEAMGVTVARILAQATGRPHGPVHLNVPFAKPLEPEPGTVVEPHHSEAIAHATSRGHGPTRGHAREEEINAVAGLVERHPRGVIVCGPRHAEDGLPAAVTRLHQATGYPVLADPLSGTRFGPGAADVVLGAYDAFLAAGFDAKPELVIRFGAFPTSGSLERWLTAAEGIPHITVTDGFPERDPIHAATHHVDADAPSFADALATRISMVPDKAWTERFRNAERLAMKIAGSAFHADPFEGVVPGAILSRLGDGATLWVSSSMPVRDLDRFGAPSDVDIRCLANRGASGIDGVVSSALGAALAARDRSDAPVVLYTGDLAFYHDLSGLIALERAGVDATLVVVNNDGGGIFEMLPIREHEPAYTTLFRTPHGLDFSHVCRMFGLGHERVADAASLGAALDRTLGRGRNVIEFTSDAKANVARRRAAEQALREALVAEGT